MTSHAGPAEATEVPPHPGLAGMPVYADYNATTPVDPRVADAMSAYLGPHFGNPSSAHPFGDVPRAALDTARTQLAALIGAEPTSVVFTGSGSEANALALRGAVLATGADRPQLITQVTEHPSVLGSAEALARWHGVEVIALPVDGHGRVDPADLKAAITSRTVLVSVMMANNETGALQPVAELARVAHDHGVLVHTDAAQAVGKVGVDVGRLGVDLLTVVGHKLYAPKGIAALHVGSGIELEPVAYGGGQERGLRAGTENVAGAAGLGAAAELARHELAAGSADRLRARRDRLHDALVDRLGERVLLNGHPEHRLPNTLNVSIAGTRGDRVLASCPDVAASTGSACHSDDPEPSPVLTAMGLDVPRCLAALRLSLGRWSTDDEVDRLAAGLAAAAR
jgi:cysteine desulfurase